MEKSAKKTLSNVGKHGNKEAIMGANSTMLAALVKANEEEGKRRMKKKELAKLGVLTSEWEERRRRLSATVMEKGRWQQILDEFGGSRQTLLKYYEGNKKTAELLREHDEAKSTLSEMEQQATELSKKIAAELTSVFAHVDGNNKCDVDFDHHFDLIVKKADETAKDEMEASREQDSLLAEQVRAQKATVESAMADVEKAADEKRRLDDANRDCDKQREELRGRLAEKEKLLDCEKEAVALLEQQLAAHDEKQSGEDEAVLADEIDVVAEKTVKASVEELAAETLLEESIVERMEAATKPLRDEFVRLTEVEEEQFAKVEKGCSSVASAEEEIKTLEAETSLLSEEVAEFERVECQKRREVTQIEERVNRMEEELKSRKADKKDKEQRLEQMKKRRADDEQRKEKKMKKGKAAEKKKAAAALPDQSQQKSAERVKEQDITADQREAAVGTSSRRRTRTEANNRKQQVRRRLLSSQDSGGSGSALKALVATPPANKRHREDQLQPKVSQMGEIHEPVVDVNKKSLPCYRKREKASNLVGGQLPVPFNFSSKSSVGSVNNVENFVAKSVAKMPQALKSAKKKLYRPSKIPKTLSFSCASESDSD